MSTITNLGHSKGTVGAGDIVLCRGKESTVTSVVIHPPGTHNDSPIVNDMQGVEAVTDNGSRWTGAVVAFIGSDLRVHWTREDNES